MAGYELTETLWLTEDKESVVQDGQPGARFLLGVPGQVIPEEEAARLGLSKKPAAKAVHPDDAAVADKAVDGPRGKR
jgi:hypothetical protein